MTTETQIRNTRYAILANRLLSSHLYICRERSTNQLLFMQNKPNFRKAKMNVNSLITMDYENISDWTLSENKPNSNPIKANFKKAQMNVNSLITKDYRKNDAFTVRKNKPNSNPISSKAKMNANAFSQKDYENETAFRLQKNKPNSNPIKACPERSRMGQFPKGQNVQKIACRKIRPHPTAKHGSFLLALNRTMVNNS